MDMERKPLYSYHYVNSEKTMINKRSAVSNQQLNPPIPPLAKGGFEAGFTLVELLITMVVFVLVIAAGSQILTGLLTQFKQQSKIAETNIEGIIGLEMLRQDIEHAGYGLPWNAEIDADGDGNDWEQLTNYNEASTNIFSLNDAPTNPPRAIVSMNSATFSSPNNIFDGSDYLVIKAVNIARNAASEKWTVLKVAPFTSPYNPRLWTPTLSPPKGEDFESTDRVIVLSMGATTSTERRLIVDSTPKFYETYNNITSSPWPPPDMTETRIIYGINTSTANTPRRPFNRADYMIRRPATNMPSRCAQKTGILYKATMNHDDSGNYDYLPLLDCVADMQVVYGVDQNTPTDGVVDCYTNDLSGVLGTVDATNIRDRVREVRVYILAQEGQYDRDFTFTPPLAPSSIRVGQPSAEVSGGSCTGEAVLGRDFDLSGIPDWQNYRWKVYTMVVKPNNLR